MVFNPYLLHQRRAKAFSSQAEQGCGLGASGLCQLASPRISVFLAIGFLSPVANFLTCPGRVGRFKKAVYPQSLKKQRLNLMTAPQACYNEVGGYVPSSQTSSRSRRDLQHSSSGVAERNQQRGYVFRLDENHLDHSNKRIRRRHIRNVLHQSLRQETSHDRLASEIHRDWKRHFTETREVPSDQP